VILTVLINTAMEFKYLLTEISIEATIHMENLMEKDNIFGRMERSIWVIFKMA
jgi:hypothetical protein